VTLPGTPDAETVVTITFTERGDKTEMTFHQTGLTDEHQRIGVHDGWSQALDRLAEALS
jgi:uncharacterized protein YndB with AHSA1/START domain